jgi:serine phosphatase RsbU (regulator of sigma subunit)
MLIKRSDLLIAYTDGLSEAEDHEGRAFGIDPCRDAASLSCQRSRP